MAQVSQLSPALARGVLQLAQAVLAASRNWALYPPEHPAVGHSLDRLEHAIRQTVAGAVFTIGVTPDTLLVEGAVADRNQSAIAEAAALLHDRDILHLTFVGEVPADALRALLKVLMLEEGDRRSRGGPAQIWRAEGHPSIVVDQVDYGKLLKREQVEMPEAARRDDLWHAIVLSISAAHHAAFDETAQQRLLAIGGSAGDIRDLANAVMAPKCTPDGSPMITTQAATVLAAFRHLSSIASVMTPERLPDVMGHLASAASQLDPHVVMQLLQAEEDTTDRLGVVRGLTGAFNDEKVAQLLATALALDGQASDRLATIIDTIAPDEERKERVLTLTRNLLSETDFGRSNQFRTIWTSMEELLISYNEKPFMSEAYRAALDGAAGRAERMAAADLPPELPAWMETLGQESVRSLSVQLLIDLLAVERDATRAAEIARDMEALAEDLLMSGAYADAQAVTAALAAGADRAGAVGREACEQALLRLGESGPMRETTALMGDLDEDACTLICEVIRSVGVPCVEALKPIVAVEEETAAAARAADLIVAFGAPALSRLAPLVADPRWFAQRAAARLFGRLGVPEVVPLLQPLLRRADRRVTREAIRALIRIDDPLAARAIHTVLRTATGELRQALIDALVADRDPRIVPMLARIVDESQPLGRDHVVVLDALRALGIVGSNQAIPIIVGVMQLRTWFRRRKLKALKRQSVDALARIGTPQAVETIDRAGRTGDRVLRRVVAARRS